MEIKAKIDKLRATGFIYPIAYTLWVSNVVPVKKNRELFTFTYTFVISTMLVTNVGQLRGGVNQLLPRLNNYTSFKSLQGTQ
jgi:hypothetical protein